jgi:Chromo (CHRromatin Organisation MOdifier) domain
LSNSVPVTLPRFLYDVLVLAVGSEKPLQKQNIWLPDGLTFCASTGTQRYPSRFFVDQIVAALAKLNIESFETAVANTREACYSLNRNEKKEERGMTLGYLANSFIFLCRFMMFLHRVTSLTAHLMVEDWFEALVDQQTLHSDVHSRDKRRIKELKARGVLLTASNAANLSQALASIVLSGQRVVRKKLKALLKGTSECSAEVTNMVFHGFGWLPLRTMGRKGGLTIGNQSCSLFFAEDYETLYFCITGQEKQKGHSMGKVEVPRNTLLYPWVQNFYRAVYDIEFKGDPERTEKRDKANPVEIEGTPFSVDFNDTTPDQAMSKLMGRRSELPGAVKQTDGMGMRSVHATLQWTGYVFRWFPPEDFILLILGMLHDVKTSLSYYCAIENVMDLACPPLFFKKGRGRQLLPVAALHKMLKTKVTSTGAAYVVNDAAQEELTLELPRVLTMFKHYCLALMGERALCSYCGDFEPDDDGVLWDDPSTYPRLHAPGHQCFEHLRTAKGTGALVGVKSKSFTGKPTLVKKNNGRRSSRRLAKKQPRKAKVAGSRKSVGKQETSDSDEQSDEESQDEVDDQDSSEEDSSGADSAEILADNQMLYASAQIEPDASKSRATRRRSVPRKTTVYATDMARAGKKNSAASARLSKKRLALLEQKKLEDELDALVDEPSTGGFEYDDELDQLAAAEVPSDDELEEEGSEDETFDVEKVIGWRWVGEPLTGGFEYLIRWEGCGPEDDSWEPKENLNCPDKLDKFHEKDDERRASKRNFVVRK